MTGPYHGSGKIVAAFEAEAWAGFKTSPNGICSRLSGTGRSLFFQCHIYFYSSTTDRLLLAIDSVVR